MSLNNALNFKGKSVLITGGSDGIGYGIAQAFSEAGATVSITGTREADAYDRDFSAFNFHQLNVADPDSVESLAQQFEQLDILINCVGAVLYKKQEFERDGFEKMVDINLTGVMHVCTSFLPQLEKTQGSIINFDSVASIRPAVNNPSYTAAKAGLKHLGKALAMKWGKKGIRVNNISPGMVPTKLTANQTSPEAEAMFSKANPIGRFGTPEDMAGVALFLASPLAAYVTGQAIAVDGGLSL